VSGKDGLFSAGNRRGANAPDSPYEKTAQQCAQSGENRSNTQASTCAPNSRQEAKQLLAEVEKLSQENCALREEGAAMREENMRQRQEIELLRQKMDLLNRRMFEREVGPESARSVFAFIRRRAGRSGRLPLWRRLPSSGTSGEAEISLALAGAVASHRGNHRSCGSPGCSRAVAIYWAEVSLTHRLKQVQRCPDRGLAIRGCGNV
jgi:hypothetical protein